MRFDTGFYRLRRGSGEGQLGPGPAALLFGGAALLALYAILSLTAVLNMALHDPLLLEAFRLSAQDTPAKLLRAALRSANALVTVGAFVVWATWAARRPVGAATEGGTP